MQTSYVCNLNKARGLTDSLLVMGPSYRTDYINAQMPWLVSSIMTADAGTHQKLNKHVGKASPDRSSSLGYQSM